MSKRKNNLTVEQILQAHPPNMVELLEQLRQLIKTAVPVALEKPQAGWHSLSYHHPEQGYFCGLFPRPGVVQLVFEFGILLPDPHQLLQGKGKQVRYVPLLPGQELPTAGLQQLLAAALDLPPARAIKLGLIHSSAKPQ